jgi:hypothetical protein
MPQLAMGKIAFSSEVDKARKLSALRHLVIKKHKGLHVSTSLIKHKARQLGIHCPLSISLGQANALFQEAEEAYSVLKKGCPITTPRVPMRLCFQLLWEGLNK